MPELLGSLLSGPEAAHRFLEIDGYLGHCPSPWQHKPQAGAPRRLNAVGVLQRLGVPRPGRTPWGLSRPSLLKARDSPSASITGFSPQLLPLPSVTGWEGRGFSRQAPDVLVTFLSPPSPRETTLTHPELPHFLQPGHPC